MATTKTQATKSTAAKPRSATTRKADDGLLSRTGRTVKQKPYVSAAIATGAVTAVAAAAAGAYFFSRKDKSFGDLTARIKDGFAEVREKVRDRFATDKPQSEIAEGTQTLRESGKRNDIPVDPMIEDQLKAGAVAY